MVMIPRMSICWFVSGAISILLGLLINANTGCNCPGIPVGGVSCHCVGNGAAYIIIGVLAFFAGMAVVAVANTKKYSKYFKK